MRPPYTVDQAIALAQRDARFINGKVEWSNNAPDFRDNEKGYLYYYGYILTYTREGEKELDICIDPISGAFRYVEEHEVWMPDGRKE